MRIGTSTGTLCRMFGDEVAIRKFAEAGFDCLDFGFFHYPIKGEGALFTGDEDVFESYFRHLGKVAEESGIEIEQVHTQMPSYVGNDEEDEYILHMQIKALKAASYMGSKYAVVHPCIPRNYRYTHYRRECKEINMNFYRRLIPTLHEYNITIAVENMFNGDPVRKCICPTVCSTAEEMLDYIETLNDDHFTACLDVGHANLTGDTPVNMIHKLGSQLKTLHLHDNNGLNDEHKIPYHGNINWDEIYQALADINYQGAFSFEADNFFTMYGGKMPEQCARFLCNLGRAITKTELL